MSPPPTRLNRRNADDAAGDVSRRASEYGRTGRTPVGVMERTQPDHGIGINLRKAREKTATGSLTNTLYVRHMNEGRHGGMPRELALMSIMLTEFP